MQNLLIDTNILLLLLVGTWDRNSIRAHRRTAVFTPKDFDLLREQLRRFGQVVTTPSVLTEASALLGNDIHETIAPTLIEVCLPFVEVVHAKETLFAHSGFSRLGFADASILAALNERTAVLTDDVALYLQALYEGYDAINFNHLRSF